MEMEGGPEETTDSARAPSRWRDPRIVISVVSHGHAGNLHGLLTSLRRIEDPRVSLVLTENRGEELDLAPTRYGDRDGEQLLLRRNPHPLGFGANHNAAFHVSEGDVFCVCNPDVRLNPGTLEPLLAALRDPAVGVAGPRVLDSTGRLQDSARRDLTPGRLFARAWRRNGTHLPELSEDRPLHPDWVAGMFMAFRWESFAAVGGFDEGYFLYCEDADLCRRMRRHGYGVAYVPKATVVHDAQRSSHRSPLYLSRHVRSLARYWLVPPGPGGVTGKHQRRGKSDPAPAAREEEPNRLER